MEIRPTAHIAGLAADHFDIVDAQLAAQIGGEGPAHGDCRCVVGQHLQKPNRRGMHCDILQRLADGRARSQPEDNDRQAQPFDAVGMLFMRFDMAVVHGKGGGRHKGQMGQAGAVLLDQRVGQLARADIDMFAKDMPRRIAMHVVPGISARVAPSLGRDTDETDASAFRRQGAISRLVH